MTDPRYLRWQGYAIAQLTVTLSVLLTLSVASLAVQLALLRDRSFQPSGMNAWMFLIGLGAYFVASASGVSACLTRLLDFRLTANKIRTKSIETYFGDDATEYGKATWRLVVVLILSFAIGTIASSVSIASTYLQRILEKL